MNKRFFFFKNMLRTCFKAFIDSKYCKIIWRGGQWLKAHAWKACKRETVSRFQSLSPPFFKDLAQPVIYNKIFGRRMGVNRW